MGRRRRTIARTMGLVGAAGLALGATGNPSWLAANLAFTAARSLS